MIALCKKSHSYNQSDSMGIFGSAWIITDSLSKSHFTTLIAIIFRFILEITKLNHFLHTSMVGTDCCDLA